MIHKTFILAALVLTLISSAFSATVTVDGKHPGQKWEGWGTTDGFSFDGLAIEPEAGAPGVISLEGRKATLNTYYRDMGFTRVRFCPTAYEPENDNTDPNSIDWSAFNWKLRGVRPDHGIDSFCNDHLLLGRRYRNSSEPFILYPMANQWEHWMSTTPNEKHWWGGKYAVFNPAMIDEYAEHALAGVLYVKNTYHYEIPYWSFFNEPSNSANPSKETWLALTKATGRKFKEAGLHTKLVIADDVTPEDSAASIEYVLADPEAREYIGAVSYHRYRGDFVMEQVKPMIAKADKGEPLIANPVSFYGSAVKHGKSVWLSEQCSYGSDGITMYDTGRARANHICDEINNGRVNAFDFMLCYFIERGRPGNEETPIFIRFKDRKYESVEINPFGQWIRHFTRHIRPGAVKLDINTDDPLVKAVAFRDDINHKLVVVAINNHPEQTALNIKLTETNGLGSKASRIQSAGTDLYKPIAEIKINNILRDNLPSKSITTYEIGVTK